MSAWQQHDICLPRAKLCFIGEPGSGKSSIIKSLIDNSVTAVDETTYEGLVEYTWSPTGHGTGGSQDGTPGERLNLVTIWEINGKKVLENVQMMFYTESSVYVIVFDASRTCSSEYVHAILNQLQFKVPGCWYLLVGTHVDMISTTTRQMLMNLFGQLQSAREERDLIITTEIRNLQNNYTGKQYFGKQGKLFEEQLENTIRLPEKIHLISCVDGTGFEELREDILTISMSMGQSLFPNGCDAIVQSLCEEVYRMRQQGVVVCSSDQMVDNDCVKNVSHNTHQMECYLKALELVGLVLLFRDCIRQPEVIVCTSPEMLINAACGLHIDDPQMCFIIDADAFWPSDKQNHRPHPDEVATYLDEIPNIGIIREILFPIIWREFRFSEEQTIAIVRLLQQMGLLAIGSNSQHVYYKEDSFTLPAFPKLSIVTHYHIVMLDLFPESKPTLNWSPVPLPGDFQLVWSYRLPCCQPNCFALSVLAACKNCSSKAYAYLWKGGVLTINREVGCFKYL